MNTRSRIVKRCLTVLIALLTLSPGQIHATSSKIDTQYVPARPKIAVQNALGSDAHFMPRNDLIQVAKLLASDKASNDRLGESVSLSADGNTALVGAYLEDDSGLTDNGAAYIFIRSGSVWTEQAKLLASDKASDDYFGYAVALSSDGNTALISAYLEDDSGLTDNGAAYIFIRSGSVWTEQAKLLASDKASDDYFGYAVALNSNADTALIGAHGDDDSGTVQNGAMYVFTRSGSVWTEQAKLLANDKESSEYFGTSVALNTDGNTALIGAFLEDDSGMNDNGAAYVFTRSGSVWTQQTKLLANDKASDDQFGYSVAVSANGDTALVGAIVEDDSGTNGNGATYVFTRSGSVWTQQTKLLASDKADGDLFGASVSMSGDGNTLLIGARDESDSGTTTNGAVYIFTRSGNVWTQQTKLLASDKSDGDQFGYAVSVSSDGSTALIGAYFEDDSGTTNNGAVYIFVELPPTATPTASYTNTPTNTATFTNTSSPTTTASSTATATRTSTNTNTFTSTFTATFTRTSTNTPSPTQTPTNTNTPVLYPQGIGCYDTTTYTFFLRNALSAGTPDYTISGYGSLPGDIPLAGDWNNDGVDTIGIYRRTTGEFFLRDSNTLGAPNYSLVLGNPDDIPLHGHWAADMTGDGVGVFRPANGILYLKKQLTTGFSDFFLIMGNPSDVGISGDWDGNGIDSPGIYRVNEGQFYLTNQVTDGIVFATTIFPFGSGASGAANSYRDIPVPGDWNGDGFTTPGVYNSQTGTFYLRNTNSAGAADYVFAFCSPGTLPISGHWLNM